MDEVEVDALKKLLAVASKLNSTLNIQELLQLIISTTTDLVGAEEGSLLLVDEPATIPMNRLESGALLLFAFFMISDPKTTPDSRAARAVYSSSV